jgi:putative transposase
MEHDHAEVRHRSRVVRIFPNEASLIRLLGALAIERNEQWLGRRYMMFKVTAATADEDVTHAA